MSVQTDIDLSRTVKKKENKERKERLQMQDIEREDRRCCSKG